MLHEPGQPKVQQLHIPLGIYNNVGWLDVPVDDPLGVRVAERITHLRE